MGVAASLFVLAAGAILAFAVNVTTSGVNVTVVGYILMVVGAFGLLLSLWLWETLFGPPARPGRRRPRGAAGIRRTRRRPAASRRYRRRSIRPAVARAIVPAIAGFSCRRRSEYAYHCSPNGT